MSRRPDFGRRLICVRRKLRRSWAGIRDAGRCHAAAISGHCLRFDRADGFRGLDGISQAQEGRTEREDDDAGQESVHAVETDERAGSFAPTFLTSPGH